MENFKFETAADFDPAALGKSLCMDFDAVVSSFVEDPEKRVNGALSSYIYDIPQYPGDTVKGGFHYARYVQLPTSLIPQKQPPLLEEFASTVKEHVGPGVSFFDLGPGPEWSVGRNTVPSLKILEPSAYYAVDIEFEFTEDACSVVSREFPNIAIESIVTDFHRKSLPYPDSGVSLVWYPGSTLGNLPSISGQPFVKNKFVVEHLEQLSHAASSSQTVDGPQPYLVLLMDRRKDDPDSMINLYTSSDARGCFISILHKLRRDLQADAFNPEALTYNPCWNGQSSAVEHVFTALASQTFEITDCFTGRTAVINIAEGERYALANSLKPSREEMQAVLSQSGWEPLESQQDSGGQFHIHLARAASIRR